jgi:hypothetical protein
MGFPAKYGNKGKPELTLEVKRGVKRRTERSRSRVEESDEVRNPAIWPGFLRWERAFVFGHSGSSGLPSARAASF